MGATQLGALAFLLLCARLWPRHRSVALTALSWRIAACATGTLLATVALVELLLAPAGIAYLQWLAGATLAAAAAVMAAAPPAHAPAAPHGKEQPEQLLCLAASLVVLAAALPDPFALAVASDTRAATDAVGTIAAGLGTLLVLLVALAAFGGLCNRAHEAHAAPLADPSRLLTVAVLALPIAGLAPLLGAW